MNLNNETINLYVNNCYAINKNRHEKLYIVPQSAQICGWMQSLGLIYGAADWNVRWKPARKCPQRLFLHAFLDMTPLTMAMKVGHSEQTDQPTSNIPSYITHIKSHYPQWKSIAGMVKMKRPTSGLRGQLTRQQYSKWYHFSIINWPSGRWPCLKPRCNVTYNVG